MPSKRLQSLEDSGLIGCLDDSGVTSQNYKKCIADLLEEWMSEDPEHDEKYAKEMNENEDSFTVSFHGDELRISGEWIPLRWLDWILSEWTDGYTGGIIQHRDGYILVANRGIRND